jgi:cyclic pyranopterin phosphate synthase
MTERNTLIPIHDARARAIPRARAFESGVALEDIRKRPLRDLRISVTDRCNFRCTYCMPKAVFDSQYAYLPQNEVLSFEEITRLATIARGLGVEKVRLTGGEPLLRKGIEQLIDMLAAALPGVDLALTTNGSALRAKARGLKAAGLNRVTVSLDSIDDTTFRQMNDVDFPVANVLDAIDAAAEAGLGPVKVNMVVKRGVNDHDIVNVARHFKGSGHIVRFIEFMDVGSTNGWRMDDVIPSAEVVKRIHAELPLQAIDANYEGEVAERWRYVDGSGEVGVISSVTQAFCGTCTRARLSTDGQLFTCLFGTAGYDLKSLLRGGAGDAALREAMCGIWQQRSDNYSEVRTMETVSTRSQKRVEMSFIGG